MVWLVLLLRDYMAADSTVSHPKHMTILAVEGKLTEISTLMHARLFIT